MTVYYNQLDDKDELIEEIKKSFCVGKKPKTAKLVDNILK